MNRYDSLEKFRELEESLRAEILRSFGVPAWMFGSSPPDNRSAVDLFRQAREVLLRFDGPDSPNGRDRPGAIS